MSESTTERERTGALAGVSAAQAVGFILGPGQFSSVQFSSVQFSVLAAETIMYTPKHL